MSADTSIFPLIQEVMGALSPHYRSAIQAVFNEYGFQGSDWFLSYIANGLAEGLSPKTFHHHYPYANIARQTTQIAQAAEKGFLQSEDGIHYTLTEKGRQGVTAFVDSARQALGAVSPLPPADLAQLADLLKRVLDATINAAQPAEKFHLHLSRSVAPDDNASVMARIDQVVTDLTAFRDDAHLAAWRPLGISGQLWEALTLVWRGEAHTASELAARLPNRGYDSDSYESALQDLTARGWLAKQEGTYQITTVAQQIRDEAETQTEHNYLVGWSALNTDEVILLKNLLSRFRDGLRQLTAEEATAVFSDLYPVCTDISGLLFKLTRPGVAAVIEAAGLDNPGQANTLILSSVFEEPVTAHLLHKRGPYSAISRYQETFSTLKEAGYLAGDESGFTLTENGRSLVHAILGAFHKQMGMLQSAVTAEMSLEEWGRLADLLEQISLACRQAGDPPGTWCIDHVQGLPMPEEPCPLDRIDKVLDDLNAFRDDAHIAAFKPYKIEGHTWEFFTALWREEAANPAEMAKKADYRGYNTADYQQALLDLVKRGWVEEMDEGVYGVTENGRSLREEAESQTDWYFYLPWTAALPDANELHTLLTRAQTTLQQTVEETAAV